MIEILEFNLAHSILFLAQKSEQISFFFEKYPNPTVTSLAYFSTTTDLCLLLRIINDCFYFKRNYLENFLIEK